MHDGGSHLHDLPPGSIVIERYTYMTSKGKSGVQWLAQVVARDGSLTLCKACKTRHEALVEVDRHA